MGIKKFKPTSAGLRQKTCLIFEEVTKTRPEKGLVEKYKKSGGRNARGRITRRHAGGGHKRRYRVVDFKRDKAGIPATVAAIEYDPNRTARIALLNYIDGEKRYIIAPKDLKVGDSVISGKGVDIKPGNAMPIREIPVGSMIHNIEMKPGRGGQIVRSAGNAAQLMAKEGVYAQVRLPSSEVRKILQDCYATIGEVGNADHANINVGKAGRKRWMGVRPSVRGVAMNPVDHPHGGGEGRSSGGRHPVTPWGVPTRGYKTRNNVRTDKFIVKRRKK